MFLRRAVVRGRTLPIQTMLRRIKSRNRRPSIRPGTRGPQGIAYRCEQCSPSRTLPPQSIPANASAPMTKPILAVALRASWVPSRPGERKAPGEISLTVSGLCLRLRECRCGKHSERGKNNSAMNHSFGLRHAAKRRPLLRALPPKHLCVAPRMAHHSQK
jgi:hypothetical protein